MHNKGPFSVVGIYDSAQSLMKAIPLVRRTAAGRLEAYTPYPVEGIDKLLGLRKSPVGGMVLLMGIIGALSALAFELWTSGVDYPQLTAGKPFLSWEAFVPVMFEVTVLFATFTAGLGMLLLLNRLPMFQHPMLASKSMPLITRDKFALAVESGGAELDSEKLTQLLKESGAKSVEVIEAPAPAGLPPLTFLTRAFGLVVAACVVAGILTYWAMKLFPVLVPMSHMLDQPRVDAQQASGFFADGFSMRMPPPETVARGSLPYTIKDQALAGDLANPLPRSGPVLIRGRQAFTNNCAVCHGILGDGAGSLTAAYGAKPANLTAQQIIDLPDGKIYHTIMAGKNAMASYAADLDQDERWAVVHHIRVLQRALNAKDEDLE